MGVQRAQALWPAERFLSLRSRRLCNSLCADEENKSGITQTSKQKMWTEFLTNPGYTQTNSKVGQHHDFCNGFLSNSKINDVTI